jgi:hypothetical protein
VIGRVAQLKLTEEVTWTDEQVRAAIGKLSKKKAVGVDCLKDTVFHQLGKEEDIQWFTAKMNQVFNSR